MTQRFRVAAGVFLHAVLLMGFFIKPGLAENIHVPMMSVASGTYYVKVDVEGLGPVDFLVDTGSGYSTIDTVMLADMERSGNAVFVKQLEGVMADGRIKVVPVYRIPEISLGACKINDVEVAVFDAGTRPILGMRLLRRVAPFTFSISPPGMRLGNCAPPVTADRGADIPVTNQPVAASEAG